jgi:NADH-quinone oxidoreductase subunit C
MESAEQIRERILAGVPGADISVLPNPAPSAQHSILLGPGRAREIAIFLRDAPGLKLDLCSNATGVDWPQHGYLEVVYHLYSVELKHGPVVIRQRTAKRSPWARSTPPPTASSA